MAMVWWVLTYLDNYRPPHYLSVLAATNLQAHLFMKWSRFKPSRRPVYKRVRGINIWCGYEYIWDTPNLAEQLQPGNTFEHLFDIRGLASTDHVWYYLFSIGERPYKECQGPLIHVPPYELPMPSARIFRSTNQVIPGNTPTYLIFDSVQWDDYNFFDPANPDRLTIPVGALFAVGCCVQFMTAVEANAWVRIRDGTPDTWIQHSHYISPTGWAGAQFTMHTLIPLRPGDFLRVQVYNNHAVQKEISAIHHYSPHFWIIQVGPYPISAP